MIGGPHIIDESVYRADPGINISLLKELKKSPRKAQHVLANPRKPSGAQVFGQAVHTAILEPEKFLDRFMERPEIDRRTKAGKEQYAELEASGKSILDKEDFEACLVTAEKVKGSGFYNDLLSGGIYESSWFVDRKGIRLKGRLDCYLPDKNLIVDIKTCETADERLFLRDIVKWSYHSQAAYYMDLVAHVTGRPVGGFVILALEKSEDRDMRAFWLDSELIARGRRDYLEWLSTWRKCLETGNFPGYPETFCYLKCPNYLLEDTEF